MIAVLIRPLAMVVFLALVVYPIERRIQRIWPDGRLKRVLFDRTFQGRHPWRYMAIWMVVMALMVGAVAIWLEVR